VILAAEGESVSSIARKLGTSRSRVTEWLARFRATRVGGLADATRSGRPRVISALERHQVVAAACQSPKAFGGARSIWTRTSLAEALIDSGLVRDISPSTVGEILEEAEIRRLEARCRWRRYRDGERVLDSGSASRDVYFVASGAVSIVNFSLSGKEVTLATAKAGSYFG